MITAHVSSTFTRMIRGMIEGHHAGYRLARTTITSRYYRSFVGLGWEFLEPLVIALVFIFLRRAGAMHPGDMEVSYALFAVVGIMMWRSFTQVLTQTVNSMVDYSRLRGGLLIKPESAMIAVFYESVFTLFFRTVIALLAVAWFGMIDLLAVLQFILLLPIVLFAGLAVGLLLAPFNLVYRDVGRGVQLVIWPMMFLSGVVVALPAEGMTAWLRTYNPCAVMIYNLRHVLLTGTFDSGPAFAALALASGLLAVMGWYVYHVTFDLAGDMQ